jgi:hypothetical protein
MNGSKVYRWSSVASDIAKDNGVDDAEEEAALLTDTKEEEVEFLDDAEEEAALLTDTKEEEVEFLDDAEEEAALLTDTKEEEVEFLDDAEEEAAVGNDKEENEANLKKQHLYVGERTSTLLETKLSSVIFSAILSGKLLARDSNGLLMKQHPVHGYSHTGAEAPYLHPEDVNEFFEKNRYSYEWAPRETQKQLIRGSHTFKGITKGEVIGAFEDLHFNNAQWSRALANVPLWLKSCRVSKGDKAHSALWNPVQIAVALIGKGVPLKKLDAVFVGLKDWTDEWQKDSDYFRT